MGKGPQIPPAVAIIVIVVVVLLAGVYFWKQSGPPSGTGGVGATSAALAHVNKPADGGMPSKVVMPANLPNGSNSNMPMPGKTPTMPMGGGR